MKLQRHLAVRDRSRRGAALLLSLLLLFVLVAIAIQISVTTGTDARVARNDLTLTSMDLAIESAMLQVQETLKTDAEAGVAEPDAPAPDAGGGQQAGQQQPASPQGGAGGEEGGASDTRKDEWATPQRTEINDVRLRIVVVDEDSKYNVLNLLNSDEREAQAALGRVARILDACREGTEFDLDSRTADEMARAMLDHLTKRGESRVPRPKLLTDDEEQRERGLPRSLLEFAGLPPFEPMHFRDIRDINGKVAHSIGAFLTVWTSVSTAGDALGVARTGEGGAAGGATRGAAQGGGGEQGSGGNSSAGAGSGGRDSGSSSGGAAQAGAGGQGTGAQGAGAQAAGAQAAGSGAQGQAAQGGQQAGANGGNTNGTTNGGFGVNVNTAPPAVLKGLFDDREVDPRFLDEIIEYRNLEEEEDPNAAASSSSEEEEENVRYDEWGNEILDLRAFEDIAELQKVSGYENLEGAAKDALSRFLAVESHVFSVYVIARRSTSAQGDLDPTADPEAVRLREEQGGDSLVRVVRAVYWRRKTDEGVSLVPLVRWEVLDYLPLEVLDYPDEDR